MAVSPLYRSSLIRLATAGAVVALVAGCAPPTPSSSPGVSGGAATTVEPASETRESVKAEIGAADITQFCGSKNVTLGMAMHTSQEWGIEAYSLLKREAAKCPNIENIIVTDAQGDPQKGISDVNSLIARGVDGIVALPVSGEALLPAYRKAVKAGIPVVSFVGDPGGVDGVDITAQVGHDFDADGKAYLAWMKKNVGSGTAVYIGGTAGNPVSTKFFAGFQKAMAGQSDFKLVEPDYVVTDWDSGKRKKALAGLLAKHGRIDVVVTDAAWADRGTMDAYTDAGMKLPALIGVAGSNAMGCYWQKTPFKWGSIEGTQAMSTIAVRRVMAQISGVTDPEAIRLALPMAIDTEDDKPPACDPSLPADADLTTTLLPQEREKSMG